MKTDIDFWDLKEPARIPRTIEDWERTNLCIPLALPRKRGPHYLADFSVDEATKSLDKASNLIALHVEDFARATEKISPEAWRLFFYRGDYTVEQLGNLRFSALQSLQKNCRMSDDFEDPPLEWLGTTSNLDELAAEAERVLRELGEGPACAAWVILSVAQRVELSPKEVLECQWWNPMWVLHLTHTVEFVA